MSAELLIIAGCVVGIKKGLEALGDNEKAKIYNNAANTLIITSEFNLKREKKKTSVKLQTLGKVKLCAWDKQMNRFIRTFGMIKDVEVTRSIKVGELQINNIDWQEMKPIALGVDKLLSGGLTAVGAGAVAGVAVYGGASLVESAALASVVGVSTGAMLLGGVVTGAMLSVAGMMAAAQAERRLSEAESNFARAKQMDEEVKTAVSILKTVCKTVEAFLQLIRAVEMRMDKELLVLEKRIASCGTDYSGYDRDSKELVHRCFLYAQMMKMLLETPLLNKDGYINEDTVALEKNIRRAI